MADERGAIKPGSPGYGAIDGVGDNAPGTSKATITIVPQPVEHHNLHGWRAIKYKFREPLAEFLGTFVLVVFGVGSIAQTVLSEGKNGNWLTIALSFGFGLALAIAVSGHVSGGHLNPAVTITMAVFRKFSWLKVPTYILAQTTGAFVAAGVVYTNYVQALDEFDGGHRNATGPTATAGIFATYPVGFINGPGAFFSEALGTFFLILVILAVTDERHVSTAKYSAPITIGLTLTTIALSGGWETGFALNPARDFGPRLFTFFAGYGVQVFAIDRFYFWVPLVAPVFGGLLAGVVYDGLIYTGSKSPLNRA